MTLVRMDDGGAMLLYAEGVKDAIAAAFSDNTQRTYRAQWTLFENFCLTEGVDALPAEPETAALYLSKRAKDGASVATIRASASAIAFAHRAAGKTSPTTDERVRMTLKGLARQYGAPQRQAAALTSDAISAIVSTALLPRKQRGGSLETQEGARERGLLDIAIVRVMSDAGLRRSEAAALTWGDVERWADGSGRVHIRRGKTDQEARGAVVYIGKQAWNALGKIRNGASDDAPVFGLSASQISRRIAAAAKQAGLDGNFSGHSGRVGMAQRMSEAGAPMQVTMNQGRWTSPAMVARYTQSTEAGAAARYLD